MTKTTAIYDAAVRLIIIAREQDHGLPANELPPGSHWLLTPNAWITLRHAREASSAILITGPDSQTLFGLPLKVTPQGTLPVIDLVIGRG